MLETAWKSESEIISFKYFKQTKSNIIVSTFIIVVTIMTRKEKS